MERINQNPDSKENSSSDVAFAQLKERERELERMNEIQVNLAITLFPEEEDVSASMTKWIVSELSREFRKIIDDPETNYKARLLSRDEKEMDKAYDEILEILKTKYHAENTN